MPRAVHSPALASLLTFGALGLKEAVKESWTLCSQSPSAELLDLWGRKTSEKTLYALPGRLFSEPQIAGSSRSLA